MNFKRYTLVLIASMLVLGLALIGLATAGIYIEARSIAFVPVIIAALVEGQCFAQKHGRVPAKAEAWRFGAQAGAVVVALQLLAGAAFYWFVSESFTGLSLPEFAVYILAVLGGVFALATIASRFIFRSIAISTLKAQSKRTAKRTSA